MDYRVFPRVNLKKWSILALLALGALIYKVERRLMTNDDGFVGVKSIKSSMESTQHASNTQGKPADYKRVFSSLENMPELQKKSTRNEKKLMKYPDNGKSVRESGFPVKTDIDGRSLVDLTIESQSTDEKAERTVEQVGHAHAEDDGTASNETLWILLSSANRRNKNWPTVRMGDIGIKRKRPSSTTPPTPITRLDYLAPVNCSLLVAEDKTEIERVRGKLANERYRPPNDLSFIAKARDCASFARDYVQGQVGGEEVAFPLAYSIRMHRGVAMAEKLLRALYRPQNVYCIHIDSKSSSVTHVAMKAIAWCFPNVFIASKLEKFVYGGFSAVAADLTCMKDMLSTGVRWIYFLNLAGSEYPLKTNLETVRLLKLLNGTNDIEQAPYEEKYQWRINQTYTLLDNEVVSTKTKKEPFEPKIELQKGCAYNSFSRQFVEWVLRDSLAQDFIVWSRDVFSPDELVWATLNHLSQAPGGYQHIVTQVSKTFLSREVIWRWSGAPCSGGSFVHAICILSVGDLGWLSHRWEIIANKFDLSYDHYVVDCLEESHVLRTRNPDLARLNNWEYVKTFPQFRGAYSTND